MLSALVKYTEKGETIVKLVDQDSKEFKDMRKKSPESIIWKNITRSADRPVYPFPRGREEAKAMLKDFNTESLGSILLLIPVQKLISEGRKAVRITERYDQLVEQRVNWRTFRNIEKEIREKYPTTDLDGVYVVLITAKISELAPKEYSMLEQKQFKLLSRDKKTRKLFRPPRR